MPVPEKVIAEVGLTDMLGAPLQGALGNRTARLVIAALDAAGYVIEVKANMELLAKQCEQMLAMSDRNKRQLDEIMASLDAAGYVVVPRPD